MEKRGRPGEGPRVRLSSKGRFRLGIQESTKRGYKLWCLQASVKKVLRPSQVPTTQSEHRFEGRGRPDECIMVRPGSKREVRTRHPREQKEE